MPPAFTPATLTATHVASTPFDVARSRATQCVRSRRRGCRARGSFLPPLRSSGTTSISAPPVRTLRRTDRTAARRRRAGRRMAASLIAAARDRRACDLGRGETRAVSAHPASTVTGPRGCGPNLAHALFAYGRPDDTPALRSPPREPEDGRTPRWRHTARIDGGSRRRRLRLQPVRRVTAEHAKACDRSGSARWAYRL